MKMFVISKVLVFVAISILMSQYSNIKSIEVESLTTDGQRLYVSGIITLDYSLPDIYKQSNFYWFNQWWQSQEGQVFKGNIRLVSVELQLLEETETYVKMHFDLVLEKA